MAESSQFTPEVMRAAQRGQLNSWLALGALDETYDAAIGAQVVVRLLTRNESAKQSGDAEFLSGYESAALLGLLTTAMEHLMDRIECVAQQADKQVSDGKARELSEREEGVAAGGKQ